MDSTTFSIPLWILCFFAYSLSSNVLRADDATAAGLQPVNLRCEYLVNPLGLGETSPRLSWMLQSPLRGDRQVAYQIIVSSTSDLLAKDQGDLWDTARVESDESAHVIYQGKPLASQMSCFWKVRVWSPSSGHPSTWSAAAHWSMGLLNSQDWQAKWIDFDQASMVEVNRNPITVISGTYEVVPLKTKDTGANSEPGVDVTSILKALAKHGSLSVLVNNKVFNGDPALNRKKQLRVVYERSGTRSTVTAAEDSLLEIPPRPTQLWYLRKSFEAKKNVKSAMLYATALGIYEIRINGQPAGDQLLPPGWTDYQKRLRYQAYDVTGLLKQGGNAIGAQIANGWYAGHLGNGGYHQYGMSPALLAQLHITYSDGSGEWVSTDASWKVHPGPVLGADFMLGESYDATKEIADWDQPGFDDSAWASASLHDGSHVGILQSQVAPPVRETGLIKPVKLTEPAPGKWTFDLGQNMVGVVRLKVSAPAGTILTLHHAEMLKPDGTIYTRNLRGAPSIDVYTCKGGGNEIWQPAFTFHGFRYVEVTGLPAKPEMDLVTGVVIGSDTPRTGSFTCSDPNVNQLMSNIQWGQRGNYLSVPTDCPQRDERLGWMGDAQVFVRTATCNADVASFFTKWLVDVDDAQTAEGAFTDVSPVRGIGWGTPAWGDAGVICPWTIYMAYGDKRILQAHLPAMTKWVEWCREHSTNLLRDKARGSDYGDWLSIKANTPRDLIGTGYFAYSTHLLAMSYAAVGDETQADKYQNLFEQIKTAFDQAYVSADGRIKGETQCGYAMALKFQLLPEDLRTKAAQLLADDIKAKGWHLSTGFVGVSYLLPVLTESGHADVAYKLLMQDSFPSWLFSVKQGATTIWERWDGWTPEKGFQNPGMNSFNHYSLGSCGEWLYDSVAGIAWDPTHPGYKHVIIRPVLPTDGQLTSASATIGSPYGKISCNWKVEGKRLTVSATLPPNTSATIYIPGSEGIAVTESGKPAADSPCVTFVRSDANAKVYELQSGSYDFAATR